MFGRDGQSSTAPYEAEPVQKFRLMYRYRYWRYQLLKAALLIALGLAAAFVGLRAHSPALALFEVVLLVAFCSGGLDGLPATEVGLIVGIDGVCVRGRAVAHWEIAGVSHTAEPPHRTQADEAGGFRIARRWNLGLVLSTSESVPLSNHATFGPLDDAHADPQDEPGRALVRVIETARTEWQRAPTAPNGEIWASAYGDSLERILFSPRVSWLSRAAAAILFARPGTSYAKERLRHVAASMANPAFRRLLRHLRASRGEARRVWLLRSPRSSISVETGLGPCSSASSNWNFSYCSR
jgi:hypothetical protein